MPSPSSPAKIASDLRVPERIMLFCLASGTPWEQVGVTHTTPQHLLLRNLIDREHGGSRFKLTPLGRDVARRAARLDRRSAAQLIRGVYFPVVLTGPSQRDRHPIGHQHDRDNRRDSQQVTVEPKRPHVRAHAIAAIAYTPQTTANTAAAIPSSALTNLTVSMVSLLL
jgi:hypothetical protein